MQKIDLHDNVALTSAHQLKKICKPLEAIFDITCFRYMKKYADGSRATLCNHPDSLRYFYEEAQYVYTWYDGTSPISSYKLGWVPWMTKSPQNNSEENELAKDLKKLFQLAHGITFLTKGNEFIELYDFSTFNPLIYNIDLNVFKHFIFFFREQAKDLIQVAHKEKIKVPVINERVSHNKLEGKNKDFFELTPVKKYYLHPPFHASYLTHREMQCFQGCVVGKTAKETACLLSISKKTVEQHLEKVKHKLDCYNHSQLVKIAIDLDIISL